MISEVSAELNNAGENERELWSGEHMGTRWRLTVATRMRDKQLVAIAWKNPGFNHRSRQWEVGSEYEAIHRFFTALMTGEGVGTVIPD